MLDIREENGNITFKIKAKPKAKDNAIRGIRGDSLIVSVTAAPEKGRANKAIIELLAQNLKIAKSFIEIISGESYSEKILRISNYSTSKFKEILKLK
jgi:hypothetical protein